MSWFRLKACPKCHGDLASDEGDWLCLQCGTYYYTGLYDYPGSNKAQRPSLTPEAATQVDGRSSSPVEPDRRDGPKYPPQRQERSLGWALMANPAMASSYPVFVSSTTDLLPSYITRKVDLARSRQ